MPFLHVFRRKGTGSITLGGLLSACLLWGTSLAAGLDIGDYLEMDHEERARVIERYTKKESDGWVHVTALRYAVHASLEPAVVLEWALRMDAFYQHFEKFFQGDFKLLGKPDLYIFPDAGAYAAFLGSRGIHPGWSWGMYIPHLRILAGYVSEKNGDLESLLYHEGTHQLLHYYTGKDILPPWFNEGVATNFETWDIELPPSQNIYRSAFNSPRLEQLLQVHTPDRPVSLRSLMELDWAGWNGSPDPLPHYAQAWSIINFFFSSPKGQKNFNRILRAVLEGRDLIKGFGEKGMEALEREWFEDIEARQRPTQLYFIPAERAFSSGQFRQVLEILKPGLEAHPDFADLHYLCGLAHAQLRQHDRAVEALERCTGREPLLPDLHLHIGIAYFQLGNHASASAAFNRAQQQDKGNSDIRSWILKNREARDESSRRERQGAASP